MSPLPTGHVGDLGAALVDDQLDPALRELVLRHMVGCVMCRHDVEEQRLLKARLGALATPGLPLSLFSRLSALDRPPVTSELTATDPPAARHLAGTAGDGCVAVVAVGGVGNETDGFPMMSDPLRTPVTPTSPAGPSASPSWFAPHRGRRLLAGAASLLIVGVGTAYAATGDGQPGVPLQPAANVLTTKNAGDVTGSVPLNDPAFTAMTASFGR